MAAAEEGLALLFTVMYLSLKTATLCSSKNYSLNNQTTL